MINKSRLFKNFMHHQRVATIIIIMLLAPDILPVSGLLYAQKNKQPAPQPKPSVAYKIQIGAYRNLGMSNIEALQDLGNIYVEDAGNGISRIIMGYYKTTAETDSLLPTIHARGFTGAFSTLQKGKIPPDGVVAYKDLVAATTNAAPTAPNSKHTETAGTENPTIEPGKPAEATLTEPAKSEEIQQPAGTVASAETGLYAIEIGGYDQLTNEKLEALLEYGNLFVPRNDTEGRLMIGPFSTKAEADQVMSKVHFAGFWQAKFRMVNADNTILKEANSDTTPSPAPNSTDKTDAAPPTASAEKSPEPDKNPITAPPVTVYKPSDANAAGTTTTHTPPQSTTPDNAGSNTSISENSPIALSEAELQKSLLLAPETKSYQDFKTYFTYTTTDSLHNIEPYDPTLEENADEVLLIDDAIVQKNAKLKGQILPDYLIAMLDSMPKGPEWQYYALYKFAVDNAHDAYLVRVGKGQYHTDNLIYLHVYDRKVGDFTQALKICSVWGGNGLFGFMQSWLLDLNGDGTEDLLTYSILENSTGNSDKMIVADSFKANVWVANEYINAQIVDEGPLRQKLGLNR